MKTTKTILVIVLALGVLAAAGCKKEEPRKPTVPSVPTAAPAPSAPAVPEVPAAVKDAAKTATTTAAAVAEKFSFDPAKSLDAVKAEAAKMDASQLRSMAQAALAAIKDNQSLISTLTAQQKAIPLDKMATDGAKIMEQLKTAQGALTALKDQFKVYYDALVAKGGDTTGLQMP